MRSAGLSSLGGAPAPLHGPVLTVIKGRSQHIVVHADDSITRLSAASLQPLTDPTSPLPCEVTCGVHLDDRVVLCWVDRKHRIARMAAMPNSAWDSGISREQLRLALNSNRTEDTHPADSIWSHELSAEPLALTEVEGDLAFCTLDRGLYRVTVDSEEVWRAPLPEWQQAWPAAPVDIIESMYSVDDVIWLFTDMCGYAALSSKDGSLLDVGRLPVSGRLSFIRHDFDEGSWLIVVDEKLLTLNSDFAVTGEMELKRSVNDAIPIDGGWAWTGWRLDGTTDADAKDSEHAEIGIAIFPLEGNLWTLRNDGGWHRHPATAKRDVSETNSDGE